MMYGRYRPDQIARMMVILDAREESGELTGEARELYHEAKERLLFGHGAIKCPPSPVAVFIILAVSIITTFALATLAVGVA